MEQHSDCDSPSDFQKSVSFDSEGFLQNLKEWDRPVAKFIAQRENIILGEGHWEIIYLLRQFYSEFDLSPAMRPLVNYVKQYLGREKGNSIYLLTLFPGSPAKVASKIAGLPKPENCL